MKMRYNLKDLCLQIYLILILSFYIKCDVEDTNVLYIIISQENDYHASLANSLKNNLMNQSKKLYLKTPEIILTHEDFVDIEAWKIQPLIPKLSNVNASWILFLEDRTHVNLSLLIPELNKFDPNQEIWLGHSLNDLEASIIHHFAFIENPKFFKYPNAASGFAISFPLIKSLNTRIDEKYSKHTDFTIDPAYEFALFVWNNGKGPMIRNNKLFCSKPIENCGTYPTVFQSCFKNSIDSIYFGVKTCQKFLKDRVEIIKKTWGQYTPNLNYFGDESVLEETESLIKLDVPSVEQGHCKKTLSILKYADASLINNTKVKWIVITDDDTILSISKLLNLVSCYNDKELTAIGERYRYNGHDGYGGYNYITGGGGMVFSRPLVQKLMRTCMCPSPSTPDDMFLGICLQNIGVKIVHSPYFHQARPMDYSPEFLDTRDSVSFHKHWMLDPVKVYNEWFKDYDKDLISNNHDHSEL